MDPRGRFHSPPRTAFEVAAIAAGLLLAVAVAGVARHGSIAMALDAYRGRGIHMDSREKDLGVVRPGESASVWFTMTNISRRDIEIVGNRSSCDCAVSDMEFPFVVRAGESRRISVTARPADGPDYRQVIILYTDHPRQREIPLGVVGHVDRG